MRWLSFLLVTLLINGCANTGKVAVIKQNGQVLTGSYTATLTGGSFQVSNGKLVCSGNYDSLDESTTITVPVYCSDGNNGFAVVTRQKNHEDGFGRVIFADGSQANFVFGSAASPF